jgi:hypothetical protein
MFTDAQIRKAQKADKPYKVSDTTPGACTCM